MWSFCGARVLAAVLTLVPGWALAEQHDHAVAVCGGMVPARIASASMIGQ
jgi:hypothetical protein